MEGSWNPRNYVEEISYERARLSSGFMLAEMSKFFPKLIELWKPLFISLGIKEPAISYQLSLEPESISDFNGFVAAYEVNSSPGYIAIDRESQKIVCQSVSSKKELDGTDDILISYLFRRLLISLEKTWTESNKLKITYHESSPKSTFEIPAEVKLSLILNNKSAEIIIGIPLSLVEIFNQAVLDRSKTGLADKTELSIELFGVFVPPDMLLDYLRSGSVIQSTTAFSDKVNLYANGRPWAQGLLRTCQDKFAVEIVSLIAPKIESSTGNTRVSVQLERIALKQDLKSYRSLGSIILTEVRLNSPLSLYVSGENIGTASMSIDHEDNPVLRLLSKY